MRTQVLEAADGIARVMNKLFARDGKQVTVNIPVALHVRTEQQDLEEILGNLMDNACKWARTRVEIHASADDDGMVVICIDDDGPGLAPEEREQSGETRASAWTKRHPVQDSGCQSLRILPE